MADTLSDRIQAATGPDEQLRDEALLALGAMRMWDVRKGERQPNEDPIAWSIPSYDEVVLHAERPDPTTDLNFLVAQIPEGWQRQGIISWPGRDNGKYIAEAKCTLHHDISSGGGPRVYGYGATPALALLDALVKVKEAEDA